MREQLVDLSSLSTPFQLPLYTSQKYADSCANEYSRYVSNSSVIAHAVVSRGRDGVARTTQFPLPDQLFHHACVPMVGRLTDVTEFPLPNNQSALAGMVGDTQMISRRSYDLIFIRPDAESETYTFYPLSPKKNPKTQEDRSIFYDTSEVPIFKDTPEAREFLERIPPKKKTSDPLIIVNEDVKERIKISVRKPDQNTVMGRHHRSHSTGKPTPRPAVTEMEEFALEHEEVLTHEAHALMLQSAKAPLFTSKPEGQWRAEWLHRHSHNLHPKEIDPQRADNLGAAARRYNTQMMILERTVQFFSLQVPRSESMIHGEFDMLLDSEVIRKIHFMVFIEFAGVKIKLTQHINCFQKDPQDVKASDLASLIGILYALLLNTQPRSVQAVTPGRFEANIIPFRGNFFQPPRENASRVQEVVDDDEDEDMKILMGGK